jgi:protein TonB
MHCSFAMPVTNSGPRKLQYGHPLEKVAFEHPELLAPTRANKTAVLAAKPPAKKEPVVKNGTKTWEGPPDEDEDAGGGITGNVDFGSYMAAMKQTIQKNWQPPKGLEDKKVAAVFTIMRDGTIKEPEIVESSGSAEVDKTALEALQKASPLAPLPLGAPRSVQIRYQFDWHVSAH